MMICCFTSLLELTTWARDTTKIWNSAPFGRTPHTAEAFDAIINEVHEVNLTGLAGLCSVALVAAQEAPACRRKSGRTLWGEKWPLSGGTPEERRPLSLYCDGECRAAASGRRPSASSQSSVGFRSLSCCRRRCVQVARDPGGMLRTSGWDPPPRHFTCWASACTNHAFLHRLCMFLLHIRQK